jgi:hypothetical protein
LLGNEALVALDRDPNSGSEAESIRRSPSVSSMTMFRLLRWVLSRSTQLTATSAPDSNARNAAGPGGSDADIAALETRSAINERSSSGSLSVVGASCARDARAG